MKNKVKYINYYVVLLGIHKKLCIFATSNNIQHRKGAKFEREKQIFYITKNR